MTVRHLQSLHQQKGGGGRHQTTATAVATVTGGSAVDPSSSSSSAALAAAVVQKFQTGYQECAGEVNRFVGRLDGIDENIKKRLMSHLDSCVAKMRYVSAVSGTTVPPMYANDYHQPQQPYDPAAAVHLMAANGRLQSLQAAVGGNDPLAIPGPVPPPLPTPPHLPPSVGLFRAASAFTTVHHNQGPSSANVDRTPYNVYCDEPAVSSTSSWAEDAAAATVAAAVKSPPLDFSMKKNTASCPNKRPLGDIPVNVPTTAPSAAIAAMTAATSHKTVPAATPGNDNGSAIPVHIPQAAAAPPRPRDGPGSDPNMWRPW
ncbi:Hypothetical protein CINCED_3A006576 [Cinara cedri]|nr:Hypothetical protein CINCED_3A006576 [Cinara cedri]